MDNAFGANGKRQRIKQTGPAFGGGSGGRRAAEFGIQQVSQCDDAKPVSGATEKGTAVYVEVEQFVIEVHRLSLNAEKPQAPGKLQDPSSKHQRSSKHQAPNRTQ